MISRTEVIEEARSWLGVPWRHQGRSRAGVDCAGFPVVVCKALGLSDYDSADYLRENNPALLLPHMRAAGCARIHIPNARPADLILFRQAHRPAHFGVLSEKDGFPTVIHASLIDKKVVEIPVVKAVSDLFIAAYRLPGVEA